MTRKRLAEGAERAYLWCGVVALAAVLSVPFAAQAAPAGQAAVTPAGGTVPVASVYSVRSRAGTGLGAPVVSAYVQVLAPVDGVVGRTAVLGLSGGAFSVAENGKPVQAAVQPVSPDEPLALVVIADTANERRWLLPAAKYTDPLQYLREAGGAALRQFPENGRYALYTMNTDGVAPLADRTSAANAAAQLADRGGAGAAPAAPGRGSGGAARDASRVAARGAGAERWQLALRPAV